MAFHVSSFDRTPCFRSLDMHREAFLKQRWLGATGPCRLRNAVDEERRGRRAARRTKSANGDDKETDEIEQRDCRPHHETRRIATHNALRCRDQIDTDPAAGSRSRRVKRLTPRQKNQTAENKK